MSQESHPWYEVRTVTDCNGDTLDWWIINNDYHFAQTTEDIGELATFQFKDDDVMLVNYPKSGTHWVWEMMNMVRNQSATAETPLKDLTFPEFSGVQGISDLESPRYLNTHLNARYFPSLWDSNCKVIYTYRNPKDVAVSDFHHIKGVEGYDGNFEGFLGLFLDGKVMYNKWSDHLIDWQKKWQQYPNRFLVLGYEDIHLDPVRSVKKIADFLEISTSPELCEAIAESCTFHKMKKKNANEPENRWRDNNPRMYRKGKVGDWKDHFTVAQEEMFDAVLKEDLEKIKLDFKFEL